MIHISMNKENNIDHEIKIKYMKPTDESGFVAIFTVLIIMSVLALISIGFSNITRRAQRRTLDNQQNTQAFYAAESGINDALAKLAITPTYNKTTCKDSADGFNYTLDSELDVGYTCLLISTDNPSLEVTGVPVESSAPPKILDMNTSTGQPVKSFDVTWSSASGSATIPSTLGLTPLSGWTGLLGMVRMDITPVDFARDATAFNRDSLALKGYSFFLYPTTNVSASNTNTVFNGSADQNGLVFVKCASSTPPCVAHMELGNPVAGKYKIRISSIYSSVNVTINNGVDTDNNATNWVGGQAVIDVTGRAGDIFRRIQARVRLSRSGVSSSYALESATSICKRLEAAPGTGGTTVDTLNVDNTDITAGICNFDNTP